WEGPDWRYRVARRLAEQRASCAGRWDRDVRDLATYLRRCARGPADSARAAEQYPLIAAAERLAGDQLTRQKLELLVTADCNPPQVAELLNVDKDELCLWESLFFDVRSSLPAADWIAMRVVQPAQGGGSAEHASALKLAYIAGPVAARALVILGSGVP